MASVPVENVADLFGRDASRIRIDSHEHATLPETAAVIISVVLVDPVLAERLVQCARGSARSGTNCHRPRDGRGGDRASGNQRTYARDSQRRDTEARAEGTSA